MNTETQSSQDTGVVEKGFIQIQYHYDLRVSCDYDPLEKDSRKDQDY